MNFRSLIPFNRTASALQNDSIDMFSSLQREMNKLFDHAWRGFDSSAELKNVSLSPQVDIRENAESYEIVAELPGVDQKDVDLEMNDQTLVLKGEKKIDKEDKNRKGYRLQERYYGSFMRSFVLPADVQSDKVSASFDKGILTILLPRNANPAAKVKKIEVKSKV